MANYNQFVVAQVSTDNKGKLIKTPIDHRDMRKGNAHDRAIWLSFADAQEKVELLGDGYFVGFTFTAQDPFFFIDIDKCIDEETGALNEIARYLVDTFQGAAVERSQSGIGLHIFGQGYCPDHSCKNMSLGIELYTEERFVLLTGDDATGDARKDCTLELAGIVDNYFTPSEFVDDGEWNDFAHPDWAGPEDDHVLISKAMGAASASSVFGGKATFKDLFEANADVLSVAYPDPGDREFDASSADAALAQHLAFWTGNNHERIRRIMELSMLNREKWQDRGDYYLPMTIRKAASRQTQFYNSNGSKPTPPSSPNSPQPPRPPAIPDAPTELGDVKVTAGYQFMGLEQQLEHFRDCVYIRDLHKVFVPDGSFLNTDRFKATYGGYVFALDNTGTKTSKNAWEVFTESQAYRFPKVHGVMFRTSLAPGQIVAYEGKTYVNTYTPITTKRVAGDASRFTQLVEMITPDPRDRQILMSYLAGCVQYAGTKFQYCVVLQGAEGNGKSTLLQAAEFAIGQRYSHQPNSKELATGGSKFSSWVWAKLFIGVEEIHIPNKPGGLLDSLKPLLTNSRIEIQSKGNDQVMGDNVANWLLLCNRKGDVPITTDGRRYCVLFSAQQSYDDCLAWGMTDTYWRDFWNWIRKEDGMAIINNYLCEYEIPDEFNPSLISRAPRTSATQEAILLTKSDIEQAIIAAVESDIVGFRGGWISSLVLHEYLKDNRMFLSYTKTRQYLQSLGYDWHPHMHASKGKAARVIQTEQGRPTLYTNREHMSHNLNNSSAITTAYEKAQGYQVSPDAAFGDRQAP